MITHLAETLLLFQIMSSLAPQWSCWWVHAWILRSGGSAFRVSRKNGRFPTPT